MLNEVGLTLITGARACGKNKKAELMIELANDPNIVMYDMSDMLRKRAELRFHDQIAHDVRKYLHLMSLGELFPCELVCAVASERFSALRSLRPIHHIILTGCPRGRQQSEFWMKSGYRTSVIHISTKDKTEMEENIRLRWATDGKKREDEIGDAVERGWKSYEEQVLPGLKPWGDRVLTIPRSDSMRSRLETAIPHTKLPERTKWKMLGRLRHPTHHVSMKVDALDGVAPKPQYTVHAGPLVLA
jgi:hypothetical protein